MARKKGLDPDQIALLNTVLSRPGANTPKKRKAAVETAIVESNARNLPGGDADSQGWRQERKSLYPNPTNVKASADRFFAEADKAGSHARAGDLAAAVQRPRADLRGKYQAVSAQADQILASLGKGTPASSKGTSRSTTTTTPGSTTIDKNGAVVAALLSHPGAGGLMKRVQANIASGQYTSTSPDTTKTTTVKSAAAKAASSAKPGSFAKSHSPLLEMFWQGQGGIDVKGGRKVPQGFVSGHTDHVHVAAGPKTVVELGKLAQSMGLRVGENSHFGGKKPTGGHAANSFHYKDMAVDVSGDAALMKKYAAKVAKLYGIKA